MRPLAIRGGCLSDTTAHHAVLPSRYAARLLPIVENFTASLLLLPDMMSLGRGHILTQSLLLLDILLDALKFVLEG